MASNRSFFQKVSTALRRLSLSLESRNSAPVTTKSAALSKTQKAKSSDEQKVIVRKTMQFSFERLPDSIQQHCLPFLTESETLKFLSTNRKLYERHSKYHHAARAQKALFNLVHRLNFEGTLVAIQKSAKNPQRSILNETQFPLKLTVTGYSGYTITRNSLIKGLDAFDEYDVGELDAKAEPCAAIPGIRALFNEKPSVQNQIDKQIAEASSEEHQEATQRRHQRYLDRIRKFILQVIRCDEISNDPGNQIDFDTDINRKFVQHFINTAFQLNDAENKEEFDNAECGVVFDAWQLLHDYIYLFNQFIDERDMIPDTVRDDPTQPILGQYWDRKAWIADSAIYLAVHHFALLSHLEVFSSGAELVANGIKRLTRFNMQSQENLKKLEGIGTSFVFGFFYGIKCAPRVMLLQAQVAQQSGLLGAGERVAPASVAVAAKFLLNKNSSKNARPYSVVRVSQEEAFDNEGLSSSPTATAARR